MTIDQPPPSKSDDESVGPLLIHILDVGHGDSIIIEFPGGTRFGIIDCHRHRESNRGIRAFAPRDQGEPKALTFFRERKARGVDFRVEFAWLTHPHADHFRGFLKLFEGLDELGVVVERFWEFGASKRKAKALLQRAKELAGPSAVEDAKEFKKLTDWVDRLAVASPGYYKSIQGPRDDLFRDPRSDLSISAIAPDDTLASHYLNYLAMPEGEKKAFEKRYPHVRDDNTVSSAVLVSYGKSRVILGGDVTNQTWERVCPEPPSGGCHALKLSHHGSVEGNFPAKRCLSVHLGLPSSGSAVISGGYREKLPDEKTLGLLRERNLKVYRTGRIVEKIPFVPHPRHGSDELAARNVSSDCSTHRAESHHGNITIRCFPDGKHEVDPEFPNPNVPG